MRVIGIRREDKSAWERRTPLVPSDVARLVEQGVPVQVQTSEKRCFSDDDFREAGATLSDDVSGADVVFGVKEIPIERLEPNKTYMFFSHTMKGQPQNMPMLRRILELGCTLLDYELVTDDRGVRTIAFGRFAGVAGAIDTLWGLGRRWLDRGLDTPFARIRSAHEYGEVAGARRAIEEVADAIRAGALPEELRPVVIGVTGEGGKVFGGALEIFESLPAERVAPDALRDGAARDSSADVLLVGYGPEHLVEPIDAETVYSWEDYVEHPERYRSRFGPHLAHLTALVHGIFWKEGYPRFVLREDLARVWREEAVPKLEVLTDITCDLDGSNEALLRIMEPGESAYVYDPARGEAVEAWNGPGPAVLSVDILPAEVPIDASRHFSEMLTPLVPALAAGGELPPPLERALLAERGRLVEHWEGELSEALRQFGNSRGESS